jgi:hypothetical protein
MHTEGAHNATEPSLSTVDQADRSPVASRTLLSVSNSLRWARASTTADRRVAPMPAQGRAHVISAATCQAVFVP